MRNIMQLGKEDIEKTDISAKQYETVMSLPQEIFDDNVLETKIPPSRSNDILGMTEDISEDIALQLIGEEQKKPNCIYKMLTTPTGTSVVQFDMSKDKDDPGYKEEFELEEYKGTYSKEIDETSVSSGFWQGTSTPSRINPMAVITIIFILLLFIGIAGLAFLFSIT